MKFTLSRLRPYGSPGLIRRIVAVYVGLGILWILSSNYLPRFFYEDSTQQARLEIVFDILLVILSSFALAWFVGRFFRALNAQQDEFYRMIRDVGSSLVSAMKANGGCARSRPSAMAGYWKILNSNSKGLPAVSPSSRGASWLSISFGSFSPWIILPSSWMWTATSASP